MNSFASFTARSSSLIVVIRYIFIIHVVVTSSCPLVVLLWHSLIIYQISLSQKISMVAAHGRTVATATALGH